MKNIMRYKGFIGSAEVDMEKNFLHGHILCVPGVFSYGAGCHEGLIIAFHHAVDDYLAKDSNSVQAQEIDGLLSNPDDATLYRMISSYDKSGNKDAFVAALIWRLMIAEGLVK
jgi:hypothetical protein